MCIIPALPNLFADCSSNVQGNSQSIRTKKSRLQEYHTLVENWHSNKKFGLINKLTVFKSRQSKDFYTENLRQGT